MLFAPALTTPACASAWTGLQVRNRLHVVFAVGESIALLDMLVSFTTFVQLSGASYVRPKMADGATLVLKGCRHPLLEAQGEVSVVPNDGM